MGAPLCPIFSRRGEGGPWSVGETIRCEVGRDSVGLLVDGVGCAKVKGVLLCVLNGLPEVVVCVPGLKGGEFKWVNPGVEVAREATRAHECLRRHCRGVRCILEEERVARSLVGK